MASNATELYKSNAETISVVAYYKWTLNLLRTRRLNFMTEEYVRVHIANSCWPQEELTVDDVTILVDTFHKFVSYMTIAKKGIRAVSNNVASTKLAQFDYEEIKEMLTTITKLLALIQSVRSSQSQIIARLLCQDRPKYHNYLTQIVQSVGAKKDSAKERVRKRVTEEQMAECHKMLGKVNSSKAILRALVGVFFHDHQAYPLINATRTPARQNLTLYDFKNDREVESCD